MSASKAVRCFGRSESGAALVEFALVMLLFFFLFFSLIDFGRWGSSYVMIEKATQIAARMAIVRPPACPLVPEFHRPADATNPQRFGTSCRLGGDCNEVIDQCVGDEANGTVSQIWARVQPLLPPDATPGNLRFEYHFDPNLGFLGGPYTPMVTVEITPPDFQFISPLGVMAVALGGVGGGLGTAQAYAFSVSLPAEDLANGENG